MEVREALVLRTVSWEKCNSIKHNLDYDYIFHNMFGCIIALCLPSMQSIVREGKILTSAG